MSHLYTVHEQSRSILFSSDGSKVFPTSSLTHCTAIPANANVKKGRKKKEQNKYHMHQHTAYQNNFQLGDNVLYQWNSHRLLSVLLRTTGAALLQPWPCSVGLTARGSWGDVAGLLHTCTHTHTHTRTRVNSLARRIFCCLQVRQDRSLFLAEGLGDTAGAFRSLTVLCCFWRWELPFSSTNKIKFLSSGCYTLV